MQAPPEALPTEIQAGEAPGVRYRIEGGLVPVLHVRLDGSIPVFFEHHVVLWKDPGLDIGMHAMKGALKRVVAGMQVFLTEARGPGEIAFSRDGAGQVFPLHLRPGSSILVREHQFLAATGHVAYTFSRIKELGSMLFGSSGFFVNRFTGPGRVGIQSMYFHLPTSD